jgi:hypothetical protein
MLSLGELDKGFKSILYIISYMKLQLSQSKKFFKLTNKAIFPSTTPWVDFKQCD